MPSIAKRRSLVSRARVGAFAGGILAFLGATAAYSLMPPPPPGPNPGGGPPSPPPVATPAPTSVPPPTGTPKPPTPPPPMLGPTSPSAGSASTNTRRITEIIPPTNYALPGAQTGGIPTKSGTLSRTDPWASADPCVNVFVRSTNVDGRKVVSADLHGDGLIKAAVPPRLAGQLLERAGPVSSAGETRAACVPPALVRSLFDPVVNVAAVDPAVRMVRVGDRWVLAGSRAPEPVAKAQPVQLAAATTRGAAKASAKKPTRAPAKPRPVQVSYNIYP